MRPRYLSCIHTTPAKDGKAAHYWLLHPTRNGRGLDVAKRARSKFTHLAPVWYQVRGDAGRLELTGGHDMDTRWLQALRAPPHKVARPRLLWLGRPRRHALPGCRPQTCELAEGAGCAAVSAAALPRLMLGSCLQHAADG